MSQWKLIAPLANERGETVAKTERHLRAMGVWIDTTSKRYKNPEYIASQHYPTMSGKPKPSAQAKTAGTAAIVNALLPVDIHVVSHGRSYGHLRYGSKFLRVKVHQTDADSVTSRFMVTSFLWKEAPAYYLFVANLKERAWVVSRTQMRTMFSTGEAKDIDVVPYEHDFGCLGLGLTADSALRVTSRSQFGF